MSAFSPEFSKIFKTANFANFVSSPIFVIFRVGAILILSVMSVLAFNQESKIFYFWASSMVLVVMIEHFYHFKILVTKPTLKISSLNQRSNIAESMTLNSARVILKVKDWNNVAALLAALYKDRYVKAFFAKAGFYQDEIDSIIKASTNETTYINKFINSAASYTAKEKKDYIDQLDMLLSLFSTSKALSQATFSKELKEHDLLNIAYWVRHLFENETKHFWERSPYSFGLGLATFWEGGWTLETEKYSRNITEEIFSKGFANHLVGRDDVVLQVEEVLARSTKRNVILIGEPGVGKSTVIYSLAEKSAHGTLPESLTYKRFLELDLTALLSSASGGVLEKRLNDLLVEISHAPDVILYIPQIEYLTTKEGGGADITGLLLNTLKDGHLQIIGTTTISSYRNFIEPKGVFSESFEVVDLPEPDRQQSIRILEEAASNIEIRNKVDVSYKALERAVDLSKKFMVGRVLPGKAIDLLDEAATAVAMQKQKILKPEFIDKIVSQKTKTPVKLATGAESKKLLNLESELHKRIVDQEEAVKSISEAIRRARTLKRETSKPIGVFLFLGPTGVGKTETAKALANTYFGSEERIVREDMSEYQEDTSINRLIGAPPGSKSDIKGSQFTEKIRENPFTVVLLDEFEKATPKIQQLFLPIFDEGQMEDSTGRKIIFTNTIIIATSNAGAEFIRESIQNGKNILDIKKPLFEKLQRDEVFRPEFLNRFDDIVLFKPLSQTEVNEIVKLLTTKLIQRLKKQDIELSVDDSAINWLATKGYDPAYGARPLRRTLQNEVESNISKQILSGEITRGSKVLVSTRDNNLLVYPQDFSKNL